MRRLIRIAFASRCAAAVVLLNLISGASGAGPTTSLAPFPANPEPDVTYPIRQEAGNRGARLTVLNGARLQSYGDAHAKSGRSLLILNTEWENIIPLTLAGNLKLATTYSVPNLADHVYLVIDGKTVVRLNPDYGRLPGHVPVLNFAIEKLGDRIRGNLVFDVPDGPIGSLQLRFYDFAHGHMVITLGEPVPPTQPLAPPLENEVLSAAIYGVTRPTELAGSPAPVGMTFVSIDFRATSRFTYEADATAFDPKAKPGQKTRVGTVSDWTEAMKYASLVVDGEYGYGPIADASTLGPAPLFLPDLPTGGTLAFLVPQQHQSLELRCDFPNAKMPDGSIRRPAGLTLPIEGTRPTLPALTPIAGTKDEIFDVAIARQERLDEFASVKSAAGTQFLVVDVTVRNIGAKQEFFQPKEQLKYVPDAGGQVAPDPATFKGPHPPTDLIYIPNGERRSFQLVYRVPANPTRARVRYASVTQGASKVLDLGAAAAQTPPAEDRVATNGPQSSAARPPMAAQNEPNSSSQTPAAQPASDAQPHSPPRGLAGVGLTAQQVNDAIDRGARGLWDLVAKQCQQQRMKFGDDEVHVLCALALVHADAHKKIPEFDAALRAFLEKNEPHKIVSHASYRNALFCMLVQAYGDPSFDPKLREAARWLLEAQGGDGTWTYSAKIPPELFTQKVRSGALQIVGGEPPTLDTRDAWHRQTPWQPVNGDNSCTQFGILGLHAAAASGVPLPAEAWQKVLDEVHKRACADGGWNYHTATSVSYGSMTSAGICATAIARYQLGQKRDFADDLAIAHGLAWLDSHWKVGKHPKYGSETDYVYYFTYSIERVGQILNTEFIGSHEWYPEGAAWLVQAQHPDGLWVGESGQEKADPRLASGFALLFLTRATPPLEPIAHSGPGTLRTAVVAPNNRFYIILDASGSMLDNMDGRMKFDIARDAVRALIDKLPPNCMVALRVYGHRKRAIDAGADLDTELKIKMSPLDKAKFNQTLDSLRSRGKTPLALSIEDSIKDLNAVSKDSPTTLVLLTDGGEDTTKPRGDPLKAADDLGKVQNVVFHIVGFDINQADWSQQLQAMAQRSHGRYWPAARSVDLQRSILNAVLGVPEQFAVIDSEGKGALRGKFGDTATLPQGKYTFSTDFAGQTFNQEFYVSPGAQTLATFDAGQIPRSVAPTAAEASAPAEAPVQPTAPWPKFCSHCGAPLKPGQKFCTNCGQPVVVK
jgi:hypothetical protein